MALKAVNYRTEIIAGVTTFLAMAYIMIVNPLILSQSGMPLAPLVTSTAIVAAVATLLTGLYAKMPFAMAPYMGENVLFTFGVVLGIGVTYREALGVVFWGGVIFLLVTLLGLRPILAKAVPESLSLSWSVGIGLFLAFVGFAMAGLSVPGVPGAPVHIGKLTSKEPIIAIVGTVVTLGFLVKGFKPGILVGIIVTMVLEALAGIPAFASKPSLTPPSPEPVLLQLDPLGALKIPSLIPMILVFFLVDIFDTMGTVVGLCAKAGLEQDKVRIERVFRVDALASVLAPFLGNSTSGTFIESAAGIESGGRTGLTSIVTGLLFILSIPIAGVIGAMNPAFLQVASAPALIAVGIMMMSVIAKVKADDLSQVVPLAITLMFMLFTYSIAMGISASLVAYPLVMLATGRRKEIHPVAWILFALGLLFFIFYPY